MYLIEQKFADIYSEELASGAILNEEYEGFKQDYLVLHCLIRKYGIKSCFEIGTNMGTGTKILKNAMGEDSRMYSLDLPTELAHISLQHPINEGKGDSVGHRCDLPFVQLRGDSLNFDYNPFKDIEAFYIDGEHDFQHAYNEAWAAINCNARLIMFHDSDMPEVYNGIVAAFFGNEGGVFQPDLHYDVYRVIDTRICYAVKKK